MKTFLGLLLLGSILMAIALGVRSGKFARQDSGDQPINRQMREASAQPFLSAADEEIILRQYGGARVLPSGLRFITHQRGDGPKPERGATVTAHYTGRFLDGTQFDSSRDRGRPFQFEVGMGRVIRGWDEAFLDMQKGERRTLIIPYWLAYGEGGSRSIPPRATLVFEVEMLDFER